MEYRNEGGYDDDRFPLGYELHCAAHQFVEEIETMHKEHMEWINEYYDSYVKSLSSSKDLLPKTQKSTRKRHAAMDDQPAKVLSTKRSTRVQARKKLKNMQQLEAEVLVQANSAGSTKGLASVLKVQEKRHVEGPPYVAVRAETVAPPPSLSSDVTGAKNSLASSCRAPIAAGCPSRNAKNSALAHETVISDIINDKRVTGMYSAAPTSKAQSTTRSSSASSKPADQWGSNSGSTLVKDGVRMANIMTAPGLREAEVLQCKYMRSRGKVIARKTPITSAAMDGRVRPQPALETPTGKLSLIYSKSQVSMAVVEVPIIKPTKQSEWHPVTKRPSEDTCQELLPPAKQMRKTNASLPHFSASTPMALPTRRVLKGTTADGSLQRKKHYTPDNVRTESLTAKISGRKSVLTASKPTPLLNKSLFMTEQGRLVTAFRHRTTPVHASSVKETQRSEGRVLLEQVQVAHMKTKQRDRVLEQRLEITKRHQEETMKRAETLREQEKHNIMEKQPVVTRYQAKKNEELYRAINFRTEDEKQKSKMRDLKLKITEEKQNELKFREMKNKQQEQEVKVRGRRDHEFDQQRKSAALKASRAAAAGSRQHLAPQLRGEKATAESSGLVAPVAMTAGGHVSRDYGGESTTQPCFMETGSLPQAVLFERDASTNAGSALAAAPGEKSGNRRLTITKVSSAADTHAVAAPPDFTAWWSPPDNSINYEISDHRSSDETDDETRPQKPIARWAQGLRLKLAVLDQHNKPVDVDALFPDSLRQPCDLTAIFRRKKRRYLKRTSSANWSSPII